MAGPTALEVHYSPAPASAGGVLLGAGARWLLLAAPDVPEPELERLWRLVASPRTPSQQVVEAVEQLLGPAGSFALADLGPGGGPGGPARLVSRGEGRAEATERGHQLRLGEASSGPGGRRIGSGVVAARAAVLWRPTAAPAPPVPAAAPHPVIDGIPAEILAARSSPTDAPPATFRPPTAPPAPPPGPAPPVHTVRRSPAAPPEPGTEVDHLRQSTHETVLAARCPRGHLTPALTASCRVCHAAVPPQEPQRLPRPRLGVLLLPDGHQVPLDRGVVLGRQPAATSSGTDWPHLVRLPPDHSYVSRSHLLVELDGWLVLATDLGSRGGTTLRVPGRSPERIRAHEPYVWEPGQVLDLADGYEVLFQVT